MAEETVVDKRETTSVRPERTHGGRTYLPSVDIIENREELLLLADVPGADSESINIDYENGMLTLHARVRDRQDADTAFLLREYGIGDYYREFRVSEAIDPRNIQAEVKHGVLTVHLPKNEAAKPRKISVKTA